MEAGGDSALPPERDELRGLLPGGQPLDPWLACTLGGGVISGKSDLPQVYELQSFAGILERCEQTGQDLWEFVQECEGEAIWSYLREVWGRMQEVVFNGKFQANWWVFRSHQNYF